MADYTSVLLLKQMVPSVGSVTSITSADIALFIRNAESIVNAKISKSYAVPISPAPPLLETISTDISLYRLLALRMFTQAQMNESVWPDKFKESMETLDDIAAGKTALVNRAGTLVDAAVGETAFRSSTLDYDQTMTEDNPVLSVIDPEKLTDVRGARG